MIETTQNNKYIGLIQSGAALMLVYEHGTLTIDSNQPGWGVMPAEELQGLLGLAESPRGRSPTASPTDRSSASNSPSGSRSSGDSFVFSDFDDNSEDEEGEQGQEDAGPSAGGDAALRSRQAQETQRHHVDSPSSTHSDSDSESMPNADFYAPPVDWVGWFPSDVPVHVAQVTRMALQTYVSARAPAARTALIDAFLKGQLAPRLPDHPAEGILLTMQAFGELKLIAWTGFWEAAGGEFHQRIGLTSALAQALVEHAKVASHCDLTPVLHAKPPQFKAVAEDDRHRVLIFDSGLVVEKHPDPAWIGWHPLGETGRWELVESGHADALVQVSGQADAQDWPAMQLFLDGSTVEGKGHDFLALLWSPLQSAWVPLRVPLPRGLISTDQPGCPTAAQVRLTLLQAPWPRLRDTQRVKDAFSLQSGRWHVPALLGVIRCLTAGEAARELLHDNWHGTLLPAIEQLLKTHRAQEKDWLAKGVIRQPIDSLLALARRDTRLRRQEVCLLWPPAQLQDIFKVLAPQVKVQVVQNPRIDAVQKAVTAHIGTVFLFQGTDQHRQSVAVSIGFQHWSENMWGPIDQLVDRVKNTFKPDAHEHLVAMASLQ